MRRTVAETKRLSPRTKKLIGLLLLLPALFLYFGAVVTFADRLPAHWFVRLVYFMAAGVLWAAPMIPMMRWMERDPASKAKSAD